jgi:multisubunit Na+/H+ antiporter MnhB subunit
VVSIIVAIIGFVVGANIAIGTLVLAIGGSRGRMHQAWRRRPLVRLLGGLYVIALGAGVAVLAHGLGS